MVTNGLECLARSFLKMALRHPESRGGELIGILDGAAQLRLNMNVEMPLDMKVDGKSPFGVQRLEPIDVWLPADYPWSPPRFTLRQDFPRDLSHLQPDSLDKPPRPCLLDGSLEEFFAQFGLAEAGAFHMIEQLAIWLRRAAVGGLIDPLQGWEPTMRRDIADMVSLDSNHARGLVDRKGGWAVLGSTFLRCGPVEGEVGAEVQTWVLASTEQVPLRNKPEGRQFAVSRPGADLISGGTVTAIVWPDKKGNGSPTISDRYFPETVSNMHDLFERASALGCERGLRGFVENLERAFSNMTHVVPVPVGVVLCARRPFHLIGETSPIELIPYVVEIRAEPNRTSLLRKGNGEPVAPAVHRERLSRALLQEVSGAREQKPIALLGCGSVGSKIGMHFARSGQVIAALADSGWLQPHNMARHALSASHMPTNKAKALATELSLLDQSPSVHTEDLARALRDPKAAKLIIPSVAKAIVNATASLTVREGLAVASKSVNARVFETALFGRGRGAYVLASGHNNNPTASDLIAELYATIGDEEARRLMFDPNEGLTRIQIGQGCGSLSMPMSDARLSGMSAGIAEVLSNCMAEPKTKGSIHLAISEPGTPTTIWTRQEVLPFLEMEIAGGGGWTLRLSQRVADQIRSEVAMWSAVETGGIIMGVASARLKVVTAVDILPAPPDSQRAAGHFLLGTQGLQAAIEARHLQSGQTLFDIGTWHSHLADEGASQTDWTTAAKLAAERAPPSVLVIVTPKRFLAIMASENRRG
ncbi:MAG: hypothetical protein QUV12_02690 [Blastomonas fulva]|nr:hypothetical protein [Blastomonas fulva]